ncbi:transposase [Streptomyces sp. NPDC001549]|uniref:transposase n=1 Tax=Streptomyces sp. NPDC001549 TaxID=3364586 RepID=UPI0036A1D325
MAACIRWHNAHAEPKTRFVPESPIRQWPRIRPRLPTRRSPIRSRALHSAFQVGRILADLDLKSHKVRGWLTRRDAPRPFTAFLDHLGRLLPRTKNIHVVLDNGSPHTARHTKAGLTAHPRWHLQWTRPHASWLNQVEPVSAASRSSRVR